MRPVLLWEGWRIFVAINDEDDRARITRVANATPKTKRLPYN